MDNGRPIEFVKTASDDSKNLEKEAQSSVVDKVKDAFKDPTFAGIAAALGTGTLAGAGAQLYRSSTDKKNYKWYNDPLIAALMGAAAGYGAGNSFEKNITTAPEGSSIVGSDVGGALNWLGSGARKTFDFLGLGGTTGLLGIGGGTAALSNVGNKKNTLRLISNIYDRQANIIAHSTNPNTIRRARRVLEELGRGNYNIRGQSSGFVNGLRQLFNRANWRTISNSPEFIRIMKANKKIAGKGKLGLLSGILSILGGAAAGGYEVIKGE